MKYHAIVKLRFRLGLGLCLEFLLLVASGIWVRLGLRLGLEFDIVGLIVTVNGCIGLVCD